MTTQLASQALEPDRTRKRPVGRLDQFSKILAWTYVPLTVALVIAMIVDDTMLAGESVWTKPLKFAISFGLNGAATLWLIRRLTPTRIVRIAAIATAVPLAGEQILITMQAARGVRSHFNDTTPFDSAVFATMGILVLFAWTTGLLLAITAIRRPPADPIVRLVVTAGTWLVFAGMSVGFIMTIAGRHSIGGSDGGAHLPMFGWNRTIGDLRPGHFVGLHALQTLVAAAWLLQRSGRQPHIKLRDLTGISAAIGALCAGLTIQALTATPITSTTTIAILASAAAIGMAANRCWRPRCLHMSRQWSVRLVRHRCLRT